jgi:hypothetical protein
MMRKRLREQIEKACRAILPERQIYVIFASQSPRDLVPVDAWGYTYHSADLAFRNHLKDTGRWRGRGAAFFVNDRMLWRYVYPMVGRRFVHWRREVACTAAHEMVHIVERSFLPSDLDETAMSEQPSSILRSWCATQNTLPLPEYAPISWNDHGGVFLRLMLHTARRLQKQLDFYIPECGVLDTDQYGIGSSSFRYRQALGDELDRLADVPLTELAKITPPTAFADLWQDDVRRWFSAIENPTDAQTNALIRGLQLFTRENTAAVVAV